mmetsp:Transcript_22965/g.68069  ORF Transcript_22965/g.68069 Transcript_22965/m.68069 type:complete len:242 (+) Transcript_22965:3006-3731(+)
MMSMPTSTCWLMILPVSLALGARGRLPTCVVWIQSLGWGFGASAAGWLTSAAAGDASRDGAAASAPGVEAMTSERSSLHADSSMLSRSRTAELTPASRGVTGATGGAGVLRTEVGAKGATRVGVTDTAISVGAVEVGAVGACSILGAACLVAAWSPSLPPDTLLAIAWIEGESMMSSTVMMPSPKEPSSWRTSSAKPSESIPRSKREADESRGLPSCPKMMPQISVTVCIGLAVMTGRGVP